MSSLGQLTGLGTPSTQKWNTSHTFGSGCGKYPFFLQKKTTFFISAPYGLFLLLFIVQTEAAGVLVR